MEAWPIDTNLATWVTTLSINSFSLSTLENLEKPNELVNWLVNQQFCEIHPFTKSRPGGW